MNNLNNPVLLFRGHFVVAREAKASAENIGPNVHSRAFYVSICAAPAVALNCDEWVRPIYRLHMHGLPVYSYNDLKALLCKHY